MIIVYLPQQMPKKATEDWIFWIFLPTYQKGPDRSDNCGQSVTLYTTLLCVWEVQIITLESFQVFIHLKKALQFNLTGRRGRLERVLENEKARRWDCLPMLGIIQDVWCWVDSWMWKQRDIPNGWKDESNKNECSMTEYGRMKDVLNRYIKGRKSH